MPFAVLAVNDAICKIYQDRAVSLDNHKDLHHGPSQVMLLLGNEQPNSFLPRSVVLSGVSVDGCMDRHLQLRLLFILLSLFLPHLYLWISSVPS